ncbi:MAG: HlyC/CorC family transporter [Clostridiales bacterium]|nr:HlyC/CorC family transporter [Clostridiales bacterium]
MDSNATLIVSLIVLIAASAFFSASETAFTSLNRVRVKNMAASGNKRAGKVLALSENYDKLLSGILVGNNIVNILSASLATVLFVNLIGGKGVSISSAVMTVVVLMFGEISPKTIAKQNPEAVAFALYPLLSAILKLLTPLVWVFNQWQKVLYLILKPADDRGITEEELITIVSEAENEGDIDEHESELIRSAIEFNDLTAEEILTPRVDIVAVDVEDSLDDISNTFTESGYSRIPVYSESVDNIIGILHEKDFYSLRDKKTVREMMSNPLCVVPTTQLSVLLKLLQKTKNHMAVVMDEYGGVSGIVTMEDILEELVGEIWDEHDEVIEEISEQADGSYLVFGSTSLDDLQEVFPFKQEFDCVTVNGWVLEVMGRFPQPGDGFDFENLHVSVEKVAKRRVELIRVSAVSEDEAESK